MKSPKTEKINPAGVPLAAKKRKYPTRLPVTYLYFNTENINQRKLIHPELDIHIVLDGKGMAVINDKTYLLKENCVVILQPGREISVRSYGSWRIMSFSYDAGCSKLLKTMGIIDSTPVWSIKPGKSFYFLIEELERLSRNSFFHHNAELIDSFCESLLILLQMNKESKSKSGESLIEEIAGYLGENYKEEVKIEVLCRRYRLSRTQFFRLWNEKMGMSPLQYVTFLRLKNAELLLSGSTLRINEIAYNLGYKNPRHFSGQFKKYVDKTPREFRRAAWSRK